MLRKLLRALWAGLAEAFRREPPLPDPPEPDPRVLARLTPGLRGLVAEVRIVRETLRGELVDMERLSHGDLPLRTGPRFRDRSESLADQAHQANARADASLWELGRHVDRLPAEDLDTVATHGFPRARFRALIAPTPDTVLGRPSPTPVRRAVHELAALENAILGHATRDPYRR